MLWGRGFRHWGDYKTALLECLHTAAQLTTYFKLHQENLRKKFIITLMFLNMEAKLTAVRTALLILTFCYCAVSAPLSTIQGLHLTPDNIEYWATFLHSSATIQDRVIHFGTGAANEKLLEVPLGQIDPHATIVVTVGFSHPNTRTDFDPRTGISDGTNSNVIAIHDLGNYGSYPPCNPVNSTHDDTRVPSGTNVPATVKLTFTPFYKYGSCETAQEGGYINTGRFSTQLDITKPLYLRVDRQDANEQYYFHYFLVEIY